MHSTCHSTNNLHKKATNHRTNAAFQSVQELNSVQIKEERLDESKYFKPLSPTTVFFNKLTDKLELFKVEKPTESVMEEKYENVIRKHQTDNNFLRIENDYLRNENDFLRNELNHWKQKSNDQAIQVTYTLQELKLRHYNDLLLQKEESRKDNMGLLEQNISSTIKKSVSADSGFSTATGFSSASANEDVHENGYDLYRLSSKNPSKRLEENSFSRFMNKLKKSTKRCLTKKLERPPISFRTDK